MEIQEEILRNLRKMAEQNYKEFQAKLCPGDNQILGIRIPELRTYAKENHIPVMFEDGLGKLSQRNWEYLFRRTYAIWFYPWLCQNGLGRKNAVYGAICATY